MARLLAVTAHPDDESFLFGGALAVYADMGHDVALLCLTDGQAGRTGDLAGRTDLGSVRRDELRRACAVLNIPSIFTPGLMDGSLEHHGEEGGIALVRESIERFAADVLLTFGPEGASGHEDHKAAYRWTRGAAGERRLYVASIAEPEDLTMPVEREREAPLTATTVVDVRSIGDRKRRAFLEHRTQIDHLALFDQLMESLDGRETYHRIHPAWHAGESPETSLLPSSS